MFNLLFAQSVSIDLSIELKNLETKICDNNKINIKPYLNLNYKNNSSEPLYFFKIIDKFYFSTGAMYCNNSKKRNKCLNDITYHENNNYKVILSGTMFTSCSSIFQEDFDFNQKEMEMDIINDEIQKVYRNILKDTIDQKRFFFDKNKVIPTESKIMAELKDYVVFLKPGETYIQTFDLTGFYIIGGTYEFIIDKEKMENYIETRSIWDESKNRGMREQEYLPAVVNGYKLFSDKIKTNTVKIKFESLKKVK